MNKIKNYLRNQSKSSKIILSVAFAIDFIFSLTQIPSHILPTYGLGAFAGRLVGQFLGFVVPIILIALVLSLILYFAFRSVAEKYKKYLDYFSAIFLVISLILIYINYTHPMH